MGGGLALRGTTYPVWVVGLVVAIVSESCIDPALVFLGHSRRWVDQGDVLVLLKMRCGLQELFLFTCYCRRTGGTQAREKPFTGLWQDKFWLDKRPKKEMIVTWETCASLR